MTGCSVRCGGACCRRFTINPLLESRAVKYREVVVWRDAGGVMEPWMDEVVLAYEMLVALPAEPDMPALYTCRHHDVATGLCTVYERRPAMCRDYPAFDPQGRCGSCGFTTTPRVLPVPDVVAAPSAAHSGPVS